MANSTSKLKKSKAQKPAKPYKDFPLFPHASGRWAKKINGKFHYFGKWDDPDAALQKYLDEKEDRYAGRTPRNKSEGLSLRELSNRFLTSKKHLLDNNEIRPGTFREYFSTAENVTNCFGKNRIVEDLIADDFERLRMSLSKRFGPVALGNEINRVRILFKYGFDASLIDQPVRFGPGFKRPSKKVLRLHRAKKGKRMFEANEIQNILKAASPPLHAMTLLGINCAFGQTDISALPIGAVDYETGWIEFARVKTGIHRRIPIWPETIKSLKLVLKDRKKKTPFSAAEENLLFLNKNGNSYVRYTEAGVRIDGVTPEYTKLLKSLNLKRPGINFYALRHGFETIAGESKDQVATNAVMGHVDESMAGAYRERISDERLKNVTDVVHDWLFSVKKKK
jgi:integrase